MGKTTVPQDIDSFVKLTTDMCHLVGIGAYCDQCTAHFPVSFQHQRMRIRKTDHLPEPCRVDFDSDIVSDQKFQYLINNVRVCSVAVLSGPVTAIPHYIVEMAETVEAVKKTHILKQVLKILSVNFSVRPAFKDSRKERVASSDKML